MRKSARFRCPCGWVLSMVVAVGLAACADSEPAVPPTQGSAVVPAYPDLIAELAASAEAEGKTVIPGQDGWLYFAPELRHLAVGPFWADAAVAVSRATDPAAADPLPAILDFKAQLDRIGVELLFVPVPAKAAIYPENLPGAEPSASRSPTRLDVADGEILRVLAEQGVAVLDLTPYFLEHRDEGAPLYCRQDTHWSPRACRLAARRIAEELGDRPWLASAREEAALADKITVEELEITIKGDLWDDLPEPRPDQERLSVERVGTRGAVGVEPLGTWKKSPVLLLGDSHTLVFHAGGDLHATGGGLADQLALQLGFPVDLVGVRGSGATPARINLMRRPDDPLTVKKIVIWCLSVREYTEAQQGWKKVPIVN